MTVRLEPQANVFVSRDLKRTVNYLSSLFVQHSLRKTSHERLLAKVEHVALDHCHIVLSSYGASVEIEPVDVQSVYQVKIALKGSFKMQTGALKLEFDTNSGCFILPTKKLRYQLSSQGQFLTVSMEAEFFRNRMANFFGREEAAGVAFNPILSLDDRECQIWFDTVAYIWNQNSQLLRSPTETAVVMKRAFCELLVDRLLLLHTDDQSEQADAHQAPVPQILRSATAFIESSFRDKITLQDIADWAGTSGRTLQIKFKSHFGVSPHAYLRQRRLEEVHRKLIAAHASETVTDIALNCGITHLGRFAKEYQQKFDCLPHETLCLRGKLQH